MYRILLYRKFLVTYIFKLCFLSRYLSINVGQEGVLYINYFIKYIFAAYLFIYKVLTNFKVALLFPVN